VEAIGRISRLWRYPVSSLAGQPMRQLLLGPSGADGDRAYGLFDVASGIVAAPDRTPAKWGRVPRVRARLSVEAGLEVEIPGGGWLAAPAAQSDRAISDYLGFEVAVRPYLDRGPQPADGSATAPRYQKAPVHLLTTASLARLKALHPAADIDPRRFRPGVLVDMPAVDGAFPETEWLGRRIAIGDAELVVTAPCRRCGFTIIAQEGIVEDAEILRTVVRNNNHNLGVYCTVERPGQVGLGAELRFL
jgi:uncharacterized protein YcbX